METRTNPLFYKTNYWKLRTQERILRDSGYPSENVTPKDFWGKRPPSN